MILILYNLWSNVNVYNIYDCSFNLKIIILSKLK